jgi:hypothetical protein
LSFMLDRPSWTHGGSRRIPALAEPGANPRGRSRARWRGIPGRGGNRAWGTLTAGAPSAIISTRVPNARTPRAPRACADSGLRGPGTPGAARSRTVARRRRDERFHADALSRDHGPGAPSPVP